MKFSEIYFWLNSGFDYPSIQSLGSLVIKRKITVCFTPHVDPKHDLHINLHLDPLSIAHSRSGGPTLAIGSNRANGKQLRLHLQSRRVRGWPRSLLEQPPTGATPLRVATLGRGTQAIRGYRIWCLLYAPGALSKWVSRVLGWPTYGGRVMHLKF